MGGPTSSLRVLDLGSSGVFLIEDLHPSPRLVVPFPPFFDPSHFFEPGL